MIDERLHLVNIIYFSNRKNVTHPLNLYMRFIWGLGVDV